MPRKRKPKTVRKAVRLIVDVNVNFDESIMPDDDWRQHFYRDVVTQNDLAEFFARLAVNGQFYRLSMIDGFADKTDDQASVRIVNVDVEEVEDRTRKVSE